MQTVSVPIPTESPAAFDRPIRALVRAYEWLSRRELLACTAVFLLTLALRAAMLPWYPEPLPAVQDEFSYLLAADTYASGRLANPPHPMWQHFETFHELMQPVYASKYPPLQGLVLALGQKFFGDPWIGVFLSAGLMCAAVCWMLQGWIAPGWALLGGILFALRIGVWSYWMNSYWGGAIPALGAALAFGAIARIWRKGNHRGYALTWAVGIALLMHSRPYDAVLIALASVAALVFLLRRSQSSLISALTRLAPPAVAVLGLSLAAVAYNNSRVTGHALTMPYLLYDRQYAAVSPLLFLPPSPEPVYRHAALRDSFAADAERWKSGRTDFFAQYLGRLAMVEGFLFGSWPVMAPLLAWPFRLRKIDERVGAGLAVSGAAALLPLAAAFPHYVAGFAPLFYLRFLQSLSRLAAWRAWKGRVLAAAVVAVFVLSGRDYFTSMVAARFAPFVKARAAMTVKLSALPGKQLVLVRYAPQHNTNDWVYNAADIDASKIVWAREMDPERDRELIGYYSDRQVWLAEPDRTRPSLSPYPSSRSLKKVQP